MLSQFHFSIFATAPPPRLRRITAPRPRRSCSAATPWLRRSRGDKVAVRNLTLGIRSNECFGLLGPNGAGKSTAISMWTGLFAPTSGRASICGFDMETQMDEIYQRLGVCPQFDILWPLLTVEEMLAANFAASESP